MKRLPNKDEILEWLRENPQAGGKRDIARAFGIKGADRIELKRMLRELQAEGHVAKRRKRVRPADTLPPVTMIDVIGPDADGDLFARPAKWDGAGDPPLILLLAAGDGPSLGAGDRVLAKVRPVGGFGTHAYEARAIKKLAKAARQSLGIFRSHAQGGRIVPVDKKAEREWLVPMGQTNGAEDGELVEVESLDGPREGLPRGRVIARLGDPGAPRQVSLIAMAQHEIPYGFEDDVLAEAHAATPVTELGAREDLRALPLITIDPADARDHDDAVCAMPDDDPDNPGGHIVWVAIADVAHYVRPGSLLDREARRRGNSTYFPDRVSPMLPEELSADLCSLHEGVERPCLAVRMVLDAEGNKRGHRFTRAMMRSPASLAYETVQAAQDGRDTTVDPALVRDVFAPLFAAYEAAAAARDRRQPLALDLPERKIELDDQGAVVAVRVRERLDVHRLIEEFMILANVCAAETLEAKRKPFLYRVHEEPNPDKLDALRETVEAVGLTLAKGQVLHTRHLNALLRDAQDTDSSEMVSMSVLRSQTQAYYATQNFGHFGLNLKRYGHFTSPIRRYADLIVHRALISALDLGPDGLSPGEIEILNETAEHISQTERRSMLAERDTVDRYMAAFLADREGAEFDGRVSGIARFGVFVKLDETGADGLIPISSLGNEYFRHDPETQTLTGENSGRVLGLGMRATVRLLEATPITGGLLFEMLSLEGEGLPRARRGGSKSTPRRKLSRARIKQAKAARKEKRKR